MEQAEALRIVLPVFVVLTHLAVPALFLCWLAFSRAKSRSYLAGVGIITVSGVLGVVLTGSGWDWISFHVRYLVLAGLVAAAALASRKFRRLPWLPPNRTKGDVVALSFVALLAVFFAFRLGKDIWAMATAARYEGAPLALRFPLRGGRFVVGNGGGNEKLNGHFTVHAQRYALDIGALNEWKTRAHGLYPRDLNRYVVYGAEVVAPCAGAIASVVDGLPDLVPGEMDPKNLAGNHVVLHCEDNSVILAHLKSGSVAVAVGDEVPAGTLLGKVGNTGNTSEPHLHINVVRGRFTDIETLAGKGEPVPMLFDGRFLSRNDVVEVAGETIAAGPSDGGD